MRTNLFGKDRDDAIAAMDDDTKFDRWMQQYDQEQRRKAAKAGGKGGSGNISQEQYNQRYAKEFKPEG